MKGKESSPPTPDLCGDALPSNQNQDYILAKIPCRGTADAFSAAKAGGRMLVSPDCPLSW